MSQLKERVNEYVSFMLHDYRPQMVRGSKVIHDTILGSNLFLAHEIAVLDLPLLQRLRRINQVDVVSLVFPSGNHNRFEHTLGVTVIAEKMVAAIFRKVREGKINKVDFDEDYVLRHVRMAAILHDCGHGPFSHMSEEIYKYCDDYLEEKRTNPVLGGASPHEVLSYLIVTCDAFKSFFQTYIAEPYGIEVDLDFVGEMIVGYNGDVDAAKDPERAKRAFIVDVINGAFDADKIDYIQRDSHFTGIKMVLDIDRLFHTIDIIEVDGKQRLSVDMSGVSTLEQIVFNKMMLFSTVYHHHKVRAAECLFKSIFEEIRRNGIAAFDRDFSSAADFLYLTDDDVYGLAKKKKLGRVAEFAANLMRRELPKRALAISQKTIANSGDEGDNLIEDIMSLRHTPDKLEDLRQAIAEETRAMNQPVPPEEIWIDIPANPQFKEGTEWPVKDIGTGKGYKRLREIFPVDDWTRAFSENKWHGFVFTRPQYQEVVCRAARKVFEEVYDIKFNEYAWLLCKIEQYPEVNAPSHFEVCQKP